MNLCDPYLLKKKKKKVKWKGKKNTKEKLKLKAFIVSCLRKLHY